MRLRLVPAWLGLALCALCIVAPYAQAQPLHPDRRITQYTIRVWNTDNGLPQNSVNDVLQTRDGFLWLATYAGLVRYDGMTFFTISPDNNPVIGDRSIQSLHESPDGTLWIGTQGRGLVRRTPNNQWKRYERAEGLGGNFIMGIAEDRENRIWVSTANNGVFRMEGERFIAVPLPVPALNMTSLRRAPNGDLWMGSSRNGAFRWNGRTWLHLNPETNFPARNVTDFAFDPDGSTVWISSEGAGLLAWTPTGIRTYSVRDGVPSTMLTDLFLDSEGSLWIGSYGNGLGRRKPDGTFEVTTREVGLVDDVISSLLQDREGNLWVGTLFGGLMQLTDGPLTTWTTTEGLAGDFLRAIFEDSRGRLWFGTMSGVSMLERNVIRNFTTRDGLPTNSVWAITEGADGSMWFGTLNEGLAHYKDGRFRVYTTADGLGNNFVRSLATDAQGVIWAGTDIGGLTRIENGQLQTFRQEDGLPGNTIHSLFIARNGDIWAGTRSNGVGRLRNGRWKTWGADQGLEYLTISGFLEEDDGSVWLATYGGGLALVRNDSIVFTLSTAHGLPDPVIHRILRDDLGFLWMSTNNGIIRVEHTDVQAVSRGERPQLTTATLFGRADGMKNAEANVGSPSGWKRRDGTLWFPTMQGAVMITPDRTSRNTVPPLMAITRFLVDGEEVDLHAGPIRLPPGKRVFELHFSGLSFRNPRSMEFRTQLAGFDTKWQAASTTQRSEVFTNLEPGSYTFLVESSNGTGVWAEAPATLTFELRPFFYQTRWFYLLIGFMLVAGGVGVGSWRNRNFKRMNAQLERTVAQRTEEIRLQAEELRIARDNAQKATQAKSEFLAMMSHEIRTPLNGVLGMSSLLTETPLDSDQLELVNIIESSGKSLLLIVNDILDFSKIESGKILLEEQPVDLESLVDDTLQIVAYQAQEKGLRIGMSVDANTPHTVAGDPTRIRQILMNLLSNAVKFTHTGVVWVHVGITPDQDGHIVLHLSVEDSGVGIEADRLTSIFEAFTQADSSTTRKYGGTGLGLTISKRLAKLMGGDISVQSTPKLGTVFTFSARFHVLESARPPVFKGQRIFVEDSHPISTAYLQRQVQAWGLTVTSHPESVACAIVHRTNQGQISPQTPCIVLRHRMQEPIDAELNVYAISPPVRTATLAAALRTVLMKPTGGHS